MTKKWTHPKQREGEKLLGNFTKKDFDELRFKTKRKGTAAYDFKTHDILPKFYYELYPVFVQISEIEAEND